MSKVKILVVGGLLLIAQIVLLVLHYGNLAPDLPLWVVWFPLLMIVGIASLLIKIVIILWVFTEIMATALFGDC